MSNPTIHLSPESALRSFLSWSTVIFKLSQISITQLACLQLDSTLSFSSASISSLLLLANMARNELAPSPCGPERLKLHVYSVVHVKRCRCHKYQWTFWSIICLCPLLSPDLNLHPALVSLALGSAPHQVGCPWADFLIGRSGEQSTSCYRQSTSRSVRKINGVQSNKHDILCNEPKTIMVKKIMSKKKQKHKTDSIGVFF